MARGAARRTSGTVSARSVRAARQERWIADNRPAFDDYDRFVERHGVFSAGKRLF